MQLKFFSQAEKSFSRKSMGTGHLLHLRGKRLLSPWRAYKLGVRVTLWALERVVAGETKRATWREKKKKKLTVIANTSRARRDCMKSRTRNPGMRVT
jgi:hypothetical protein